MLLELIDEHAAGPIETIVDVGCGRGRWSVALAQRFGALVPAVVDRYGAARYELMRAGAIWRPYRMLGKLLPVA